MSAIDDRQETLDLRVIREPRATVDAASIANQKTFLGAITLCISSSGLQPKLVASELEIQEAQFSRAMSGQGHFPPNKLNQLMDLCGNEAPLQWLALSRGYRLERLQSEVERDLAAERQKNAELEMKLKHFEEFMRAGK